MKEQGFTLIELMITIAIIGILISIAIPAYQNYTIRARVTEGLNMVTAAKLAVSETTISNNALPINQEATNYISPNSTKNVKSITIQRRGVIVIHYTPAAGNGTILFTPSLKTNGDIIWDCTRGTLEKKYRPTICQ